MTEKLYEYGVISLNEMGDVVLAWDEEGSEKMRKWVENRMAEGATFFILKPRAFGLLPPAKVELKKLSQLSDATALSMSQDVFETLSLNDTSVALSKRPEGLDLETVKTADNADEVLKSQSVMVKQRRGG